MQFLTDLTDRLSALEYDDLPAATVQHAKMAVASSIAAAALGQDKPPVAIVSGLARQRGGVTQSRLWFEDAMLPLGDAVRINTMAADESMADDSALFNGAHLASAATAAALGAADTVGASGRQVLTAVVAGYEAAMRVAYADRQLRAQRNAHVSGLNAFATATAVCAILNASSQTMTHAMAIAATGANGIDAVSTTPARPYQAGLSALIGVEAALAALDGFQVDPNLMRRYLDSAPQTSPTQFGSSAWAIDNELIIKLRPGAFLFSSAVDAALEVARQTPIAVDEIEQITVRGRTFQPEEPPNAPAPSGSLRYYVASALTLGTFDWDHFTSDALSRPEVLRLVPRVQIESTGPDDAPGRWGWSAEIIVTLTNGVTARASADLPPGAIPRGVNWSELDKKLAALLSQRSIHAERISTIAAAVKDLDRMPDARTLTAMLT